MNDFGLDLPLIHAGKVRRLYELPGDDLHMLMVATDNISAHDHVLTPEIPDKGAVLNQLSLWWFDQLKHIVGTHVSSTEVPAQVAGRAVICERLEMFPVECVARGYLAGSAWTEYSERGTVAGIMLPQGLLHGSRLPEPLFTPATKAPEGEHDENITFDELVQRIGLRPANHLREITLGLYRAAEEIARARGLILADTKFEFGRSVDGMLVVGDEVLTPDSSRYWDAEQWQPGQAMESFDKQPVRDWLTHESGWDGTGEPPSLPPHVVAATRARYIAAFERLTGRQFGVAAPPQAVFEPAQQPERVTEEIPAVAPQAVLAQPVAEHHAAPAQALVADDRRPAASPADEFDADDTAELPAFTDEVPAVPASEVQHSFADDAEGVSAGGAVEEHLPNAGEHTTDVPREHVTPTASAQVPLSPSAPVSVFARPETVGVAAFGAPVALAQPRTEDHVSGLAQGLGGQALAEKFARPQDGAEPTHDEPAHVEEPTNVDEPTHVEHESVENSAAATEPALADATPNDVEKNETVSDLPAVGGYDAGMSRVVVDVMPKPEILDPQGKAVSSALRRLGFDGLEVRQGKRFEIEVTGELNDERLQQIDHVANTLLANTVIENYVVRVEHS